MAVRSLQAVIDAQERVDTIEYGIRAIRAEHLAFGRNLQGHAWQHRQWHAARVAATELGYELPYDPCYVVGVAGIRKTLREAKASAKTLLDGVKAERKVLGGTAAQLRLAVAHGELLLAA